MLPREDEVALKDLLRDSTLDVWVASQRFRGNAGASVAEIPVNAGEVVVYIGANSADYGVLFTIETALSAFSTVTRT